MIEVIEKSIMITNVKDLVIWILRTRVPNPKYSGNSKAYVLVI